MNVLNESLRVTIETLLKHGATQRQIARLTHVNRKTIRRYARRIEVCNQNVSCLQGES